MAASSLEEVQGLLDDLRREAASFAYAQQRKRDADKDVDKSKRELEAIKEALVEGGFDVGVIDGWIEEATQDAETDV